MVFETRNMGQLKIHAANKVLLLQYLLKILFNSVLLNTVAYIDNFTLLNLSSHKMAVVFLKKLPFDRNWCTQK